MKRLNFRLGTKSCNGQTFAKPEFIPISGIRSLAQTTSNGKNNASDALRGLIAAQFDFSAVVVHVCAVCAVRPCSNTAAYFLNVFCRIHDDA
jgi:hypothetical protein